MGCADHLIHYYDLRNISQPLHVLSGHGRAVSYVKFLSNNELASASTDSTLRLWDVRENLPVSYNDAMSYCSTLNVHLVVFDNSDRYYYSLLLVIITFLLLFFIIF